MASDQEIFLSKPFTFIIEGKPFYAHASLVAECSAPLGCMITGPLKEAQQGFAVIEDVNEGTFVRFIRWMYSKDYKAAEYIFRDVDTENDYQAPMAGVDNLIEEDDWGFLAARKKKKKKDATNSKSLKQGFFNWGRTTFPEEAELEIGPRPNTSSLEDYTEVFLSHAQVYVFAEKYDIQPLKKLALKKLYETLATFALFKRRVGDVLSLIRFVYNETTPATSGKEGMREMLMVYVTTEMPMFESEGAFKELLLDNPEMLGDFLAMLARTLR